MVLAEDSAAASGGTVKQQQLMDDMMVGAGSHRDCNEAEPRHLLVASSCF